MSARRLLCFIAAILLAASSAEAAGKPRRIEVRFDVTKPSHEALEIWVNCQHPTTGAAFDRLTSCDFGLDDNPQNQVAIDRARRRTQLTGTAAAAFVFSDKDQVTFVLLYAKSEDKKRRGEIVATVTGSGVSDKDIDAFKKIVGAVAGADPATKVLAAGDEKDAEILALTDDMSIGQKLSVTFLIKETEEKEGKPVESAVLTRGPVLFRVGGQPRFKLSYGIAFSQAPNPVIAIEKTATIVEFEKDGKVQQAYQQRVVLRDAENRMRAIESLVTIANVRVVGPFYGSLGFQVNQKIFEEQLVGVTYRHQAGKLAFNITGGIHFSDETTIDETSGFFHDYRIDPTKALTVGEVTPVKKTRHRFFLALTTDFR